ncbi:SPOR domain-containing protein [Salinibacter altiplanensis]|uniref:SPOR domain-containing protein n=1 Tax=Salinibacter altiplanensis TaxID=1803181 RepID=UPI000C9F6B4A|nr:SPOR domain-containing protein [Salinibacter altiplanensis]
MRVHSPLSIAALAVALSACTGTSQTSGQGGPAEPGPGSAEEAAPVAEYETFDPSAYDARPPKRTVEVTHQVPDRLLQGRADEGVQQTVEGFRVQVFSARDKQAAQDFREQVRQWWENQKGQDSASVLGSDPPIVVQYSQPYYRVRVGAFAERDAAEDALALVQKEYPNAFISRGTVTVVK